MTACVRCGYEMQEHNPNLVNEPLTWVDEVQKGYKISILECMETKYPPEYLATLQAHESELECWGGWNEYQTGYVSPDPLIEATLYFKNRPDISGSVFMIDHRGRVHDIGS